MSARSDEQQITREAEQAAAAAILDRPRPEPEPEPEAPEEAAETPPDAAQPPAKGGAKRGEGRKGNGAEKASSGRTRGRGRGRSSSPAAAKPKPTPPADAKKPSETQLLADLANRVLTAKGPVSQTLSPNEVEYVREALGKTTAKGEVVKLLGFKTEKALRSFAEGAPAGSSSYDKAKLSAFVKRVKAIHPSPRVRPRKVAAAALAIAGNGK